MRRCVVPQVIMFLPPDIRTGFRVSEDGHAGMTSRSSEDNLRFAVIYMCRIIIL